MDIFQKILHDYHERRAQIDSKQLPTPSCVREPSATEKNAVYLPPNYGILFCCHGKSYFDVCHACKRDRKLARLHFTQFCSKNGVK